MELDSAAAEEKWRRKEREAAERTEEMEAEEGVGEEEEIERGGAEAEEEEEELADWGGGGGYKREEDGAIGWKGWKQKPHQRQPRAPVAAGQRAACWARGGRGRGGFHHRPWFGAKNLQHHKLNISHGPGVYGGAIIICNCMTKREFFKQKLFALPGYAATFIKKIRAGMLLFLFEHEERKLYGVFEATSDGALDILPDEFASLWKFWPAQVLFRRVWFCKPLTEAEFSDAITGNCLKPQMSFFGISYLQVLVLVNLFSSKMIRLQPYQKPKSRVLWDYKISLARTGQEFSLHTRSNAYPSRPASTFCNNRISLPQSGFMSAKHDGKFAAHKHECPLHPRPKTVPFKAPDIKDKCLEPDADYIPLELDDPDDWKSDSDADQSTLLGTVNFHSTLESTISYDDQVPKPFNGKHNEDDRYHSPVLNRRLISECETGRNSVIAHIMKESKSCLQSKGCKRKAIVQLDELSGVLSPRRNCSVAKKVSFSFGGNEILVTSDKVLRKPALAKNIEAVVEGKEVVGFSPEDNQSKERDVSAKMSKLINLSFAE
ncbi:uncharacterized protein LOC133930773 [Phragmites australis]|uniref:uncharacterized protein LOC133930773 n=1 Tax=Phragmites australis TaxID=29695 RepID=UPI002D780E3D|nr:uncharacterized protein LOC133930773 [Phragmites australis]